MSKCSTCRHWSEMIAMVQDGTTVAMCISPDGPKSGNYMPKWGTCDKHSEGMPDDLDRVPAGQLARSIEYREAFFDDEADDRPLPAPPEQSK